MGVARRLQHYRCRHDDVDQPFVVSGPDAVVEPLPIVVWLHDVLPEPTPSFFVEQAMLTAQAAHAVLQSLPPLLLVQPFGRGNAGWLGLGHTDLTQVLETITGRPISAQPPVHLIGQGAGAVGALQWAGHFPDRAASITAINPWCDDRLSLPLGQADWPAWSIPFWQTAAPLRLADNLSNVPIRLEHLRGVDAPLESIDPRHAERLAQRLQELGGRCSLHVAEPTALQSPKPADDWRRWLTPIITDRQAMPRSLRYSVPAITGADVAGIAVLEAIDAGKPANWVCEHSDQETLLSTHNVAALRLDYQRLGSSIRLDQQPLQPTTAVWERWGDEWSPSPTDQRSPRRAPPLMALQQRRVRFVRGTIGEQWEVDLCNQWCCRQAERWRLGHVGGSVDGRDATAAMQMPVTPDVQSDDLADHLVVVGNPRTNWWLARHAGRLPIRWSEDAMTVAGQRFDDPRTVIWRRLQHPVDPTRIVLIVAVLELTALVSTLAIPIARLPACLVHADHDILSTPTD